MPIKVFPVGAEGKPKFSDDFDAPRGEGGKRQHKGTDIFAERGTPVLAVDDGTVEEQTGGLGGNVVVLQAFDGRRYVYSHLDAFAPGPRLSADKVRAGDVLGFVGDSGNAKGTPTHLHFEVHTTRERGDQNATNPFPLLAEVAPSGSFDRRLLRDPLEGPAALLLLLAAFYVVNRSERSFRLYGLF